MCVIITPRDGVYACVRAWWVAVAHTAAVIVVSLCHAIAMLTMHASWPSSPWFVVFFLSFSLLCNIDHRSGVVWYITFRCKIYILYQVRCSYIHLPLEVPGTWYIRQAAVTLISRPAVYVVKYLVCISTTTRKKIKPKYYHYILRTTLVAATSKTTKQQPGEVMHRQVVPSRIREDQASLGLIMPRRPALMNSRPKKATWYLLPVRAIICSEVLNLAYLERFGINTAGHTQQWTVESHTASQPCSAGPGLDYQRAPHAE